MIESGKWYIYDNGVEKKRIFITGKTTNGDYTVESEDGVIGRFHAYGVEHLKEVPQPVVIERLMVMGIRGVLGLYESQSGAYIAEQFTGSEVIDVIRFRYDSSKPLKERIQVIEE